MTMAILVQETALAWALAEAVKPHLSAIERNHVFMAIGAGETFAAIRGLVRSIAVKRIALRPDLVQQCITWLHAYVGHKDERYLGRLSRAIWCHVRSAFRQRFASTDCQPRQNYGSLLLLPALETYAYGGSPHRSGADASLVVSLNGNAAMTIESPPLESRPSDGTC